MKSRLRIAYVQAPTLYPADFDFGMLLIDSTISPSILNMGPRQWTIIFFISMKKENSFDCRFAKNQIYRP